MSSNPSITKLFLISFVAAAAICLPAAAQKSVKVFVLAGDENMLRLGSIDGASREPAKKKTAAAPAAEKPGTLLSVIKETPRFAFLRDAAGKWTARNDVALYDAHPLSNNTRDPARLLQVPSDPADPRGFGVGAELMFGHVVGEKLDDPGAAHPFRHQTSDLVPPRLALARL